MADDLLVKEALGEQAEVAAVMQLLPTINLPEGDILMSVDLVTRRMPESTTRPMPFEHERRWEIRETKFAYVEHV